MSVIDARDMEPGARFETDVCVVGAGAAGLTVAFELAKAADVCVIESGGFGPDEATQTLYDLENVGYPVRDRFMSRARYFGGSCNLWAGRSMRLEERDLTSREWIPGSGWPIAAAELGRHYPRAAELLRLPPLDRFQPATFARLMSEQERRLFAEDVVYPTVSLWAKKPMRFAASHRSWLKRDRRARLLIHGNVTNIQLNTDGTAVDFVEVRTLEGKRATVRAKAFVLACGGIENARLLLVSRDTHASGIGNPFDVVGRYFMDHPRSVHGRVRLRPRCRLTVLAGRPLPEGKVQLGMGTTPMLQRREGLLNHYATLEAEFSQYTEQTYQSFVQTMKVLLRRGHAGNRWPLGRERAGNIPGMIYLLTPKELMPHSVYRAHAAVRRLFWQNDADRTRRVVYFCEQPPDRESRVTLSTERDRLGLNKVVLDWRIAPEIRRGVLRLQELLRDRLLQAGIGELEPGCDDVRFTDASHHMGTTRMSDDPRTGVVNRDCRVHGVANLYVAGSSVFPSAGHANPTLTIVALALRLAAHLRSHSERILTRRR